MTKKLAFDCCSPTYSLAPQSKTCLPSRSERQEQPAPETHEKNLALAPSTVSQKKQLCFFTSRQTVHHGQHPESHKGSKHHLAPPRAKERIHNELKQEKKLLQRRSHRTDERLSRQHSHSFVMLRTRRFGEVREERSREKQQKPANDEVGISSLLEIVPPLSNALNLSSVPTR